MQEEQQAAEARVGTMLKGKWRLDELLGVGGMAAVYAATHRIGRRDAIKILHPAVARSPELRERFEQEAHAVNRFAHPGAVEVRDFDVTDEGDPFLVMELLEGQPLSVRVGSKAEIPTDELLGYVDELLDVLGAAHAEGIVHRDVKPDNLFIQQEGGLKVLDFGIARMRERAGKNLTMVGTRLGTVPYMPPEQVRGLPIDARADLFAVGAMMFRLIARRRVHEAPTEAEMIAKMTMDPAVPLSFAAEHAPAEVCMVVDRALAFDPARRYPDAATMQADVRAARRGEQPPYAAAMIERSGQPNEGMTREVVAELFAAAPPAAAFAAAATSAAGPSSPPLEPTAATSVGGAAETAVGATTSVSAGAGGPSPTMVSASSAAPFSTAAPLPPAVAVEEAAPASTGEPALPSSAAVPTVVAAPLEPPHGATTAARTSAEKHLPIALLAAGGLALLLVLVGGGLIYALATDDDTGPVTETVAGSDDEASGDLREAVGEPRRAGGVAPTLPAPADEPPSPIRPATEPTSPAEPPPSPPPAARPGEPKRAFVFPSDPPQDPPPPDRDDDDEREPDEPGKGHDKKHQGKGHKKGKGKDK